MAETMSEAQFREFMKRIEACFDRADKQVEQLRSSTIQRFDALEKRIDEGFSQSQKADSQCVDQGFDKLMQTMDKVSDRMNERFDRLDKLMIRGTRLLLATLILALAGTIIFICDGVLWTTRF